MKAQFLAKFIPNELVGILHRKGFSINDNPIESDHLSYMADLMLDGFIDRKTLKLWCMETCDKANEIKGFLDQFLNRLAA